MDKMKYHSWLQHLVVPLLMVALLPESASALVSPQSSSPRTTVVLHSSRHAVNQWQGKTVYQRFLYRLKTADVDTIPTPNAMVVEERLRYRPSVDDPTFLEPFGPRTLILRDGQVADEGAIGDALCVLHVHETAPAGSDSTKTGHAVTLQHGGRQGTVTPSIALALVLAALPADVTCHGDVLEIAAREGLGALMGCMGAGWAALSQEERAHKVPTDDDVLTVPTEHDKTLPDTLQSLTITERSNDDTMMDICQAQMASLPGLHKVTVAALDWRTPHRPKAPAASPKSKQPPSYQTIVLADTALSFPETRALVRTVAHTLAPSSARTCTTTQHPPTFVHVTADERSENQFVRRYLQDGCRMTVHVDYVSMEKLTFGLQTIDSSVPQEDALLDTQECEVTAVQTSDYQVVTASHHVDYAGEGEVFFPMLVEPEFSVTGSSQQRRGWEPERESPSQWP